MVGIYYSGHQGNEENVFLYLCCVAVANYTHEYDYLLPYLYPYDTRRMSAVELIGQTQPRSLNVSPVFCRSKLV